MASRPSFARRASNATRASIARQVSYFARGEKAGLQAVRKAPLLRKLLLVLVPAAAVCAWLVPFLMTGETSRQGVADACKENFVELWTDHYGSVEMATEGESNGSATKRLYPVHTLNMVSTFFSSACFLLWVHFTPHHQSSASMLDQKRKLKLKLRFNISFRSPFKNLRQASSPLKLTYASQFTHDCTIVPFDRPFSLLLPLLLLPPPSIF
jgi:hypothetical protein